LEKEPKQNWSNSPDYPEGGYYPPSGFNGGTWGIWGKGGLFLYPKIMYIGEELVSKTCLKRKLQGSREGK